MNEGHGNRAPNVDKINVVASILPVIVAHVHLGKLVEDRVQNAKQQDVVNNDIFMTLDVHQVVVDEEEYNVNQVYTATKEVNEPAKLLPLERNKVLQRHTLEDL